MKQPEVLFVLTIDTEEEWNWGEGFPVRRYGVENIREVPRFQAACRDAGIRPTYFIDYTVASDPFAAHLFRGLHERGECEIGAHLHTWVTPPPTDHAVIHEAVAHLRAAGVTPGDVHSFASHLVNLPIDSAGRKISALTGLLRDTFGENPRTFRSGRWGINGPMLKILSSTGYHTDSSVYPYYADSTFSYHEAPDIPYWPDFVECTAHGPQREIYEIPVTSGFNRKHFLLYNRIHRAISLRPWRPLRMVGILWRLGLLRKLVLSPESTDAENMIRLVRSSLSRGHRVIHMFLHSSSLLPQGSLYAVSREDPDRITRDITRVVEFLSSQTAVRFCTLSEARAILLKESHP